MFYENNRRKTNSIGTFLTTGCLSVCVFPTQIRMVQCDLLYNTPNVGILC